MVALIIVANFTQLKMPYVIILANTICPFQKYTAGGLVTLYRTTYLIKYLLLTSMEICTIPF